jgi:Fur family ferric uptake transcriptional regulator
MHAARHIVANSSASTRLDDVSDWRKVGEVERTSSLVHNEARNHTRLTPGEWNVEGQDLRKLGLKVTSPRLKVLEVLEKSSQRHMSAEAIYRALLDSGEELGLATVYRVLTQFERAGLVNRNNFEGGTAVFELADRTHHDHMVCLETGRVIEFYDERIEQLQREIADKHGYAIQEHSLVLYVRPKSR